MKHHSITMAIKQDIDLFSSDRKKMIDAGISHPQQIKFVQDVIKKLK